MRIEELQLLQDTWLNDLLLGSALESCLNEYDAFKRYHGQLP